MDLAPAIFLGGICGLVGAFAMNVFLRVVCSVYGREIDMLELLGSFFTRKRVGASGVGSIIHAMSGLVFGMAYYAVFALLGATAFPHSFFLGLGIGFIHGLLVSYGLMFFVRESHPVEAFRSMSLQTGFLHLVGHVIFGATVGLLGGLFALLV